MARRGASGSNMTSRILSSEELRPLAMFNDRHVTFFCYGAHRLERKLSENSTARHGKLGKFSGRTRGAGEKDWRLLSQGAQAVASKAKDA